MGIKWRKDSVKAIQEEREAAAKAEAMNAQAQIAVMAFCATATTITDTQALQMPDLFPVWDDLLAAGGKLAQNTILRDGDVLYRVVQSGGVTPQAHQPPHGDGMLAVYRPIDQSHSGSKEDPIPWVYGMDCTNGLYYTYEGTLYLCKSDMKPCVWAPGSPVLWQWEAVS